VEGASATVRVEFTTGDRVYVMEPTDEDGRSSLRLAYEGQPPGSTINLIIEVFYEGITKSTRESFMILIPEVE
jgi:hypothetical protein